MKGAQRATCGQRVEGSETLRALSEFCQEGCVQRSRPPAALTRGPVCHGGGYEWGVPWSDTEGSPPCGRQAASRLSPARPCTSRGLCLTCGPCKQRLPSSPKASPEGEVHGPAPPLLHPAQSSGGLNSVQPGQHVFTSACYGPGGQRHVRQHVVLPGRGRGTQVSVHLPPTHHPSPIATEKHT